MVGNMDTNIMENMDIIKENIMENMCINIVEITKDITLFRYSIVDSNNIKRNVVLHLTDIVKHSMMNISYDLMLMFDDP
jgi:hypothetical protein